jgi:hypothetical protein
MKKLHNFIPLLIGTVLSVTMGLTIWVGFFFIFIPIGLSISIGFIISEVKKDPDLGRRISLSIVALVFLVFLGIMQRENMQIEETVFYFAYFISTGIFTRVLIHYSNAGNAINHVLWMWM